MPVKWSSSTPSSPSLVVGWTQTLRWEHAFGGTEAKVNAALRVTRNNDENKLSFHIPRHVLLQGTSRPWWMWRRWRNRQQQCDKCH